MSLVNPRRSRMTRSGSITDEGGMALKITTSLQKGATFHSPSSPNSADVDEEDYFPPRLTRSQSLLDDVIDAHSRRIALTSALNDIEEALSKTSLSDSKQNKTSPLCDTSAPVPRGLFELPIVDPAMARKQQRRVVNPRPARHGRHQHDSDSGLGTSIASTNDKTPAVNVSPTKKTKTPAAIRTAAASHSKRSPVLKSRAQNRIQEHIVRPLLKEPDFKPFEDIVEDIPSLIRCNDIKSLRDVEKALLYRALAKTEITSLYLLFCLSSMRCIQETVGMVHVNDRVRAGDHPYTNGYFVDLKNQIYEHARKLAEQKKSDLADPMDIDKDDEIQLFGGMAEYGRPAELIRVKKDGTAISLRNGQLVDLNNPPVKLKRSLGEQADDDEEIMRSMGRRKKNATPEPPIQCHWEGCTVVVKLRCELTKHIQSAHTRPSKCYVETCYYYEKGFPTIAAFKRHMNDVHAINPNVTLCGHCPYKSTRETNVKQHREAIHGIEYVRKRPGNKKQGKQKPGKRKPSKRAKAATTAMANHSPPNTAPSSSLPTPPQDTMPQGTATVAMTNNSPPNTAPSSSLPTPPQNTTPQGVPTDLPMHRDENNWLPSVGMSPDTMPQGASTDVPMYQGESDWLATVGRSPDTIGTVDLVLDNTSPSSTVASYEQYPPYQNGSTFIINDAEDIYAATMQLPQHTPIAEQMYDKSAYQQILQFAMPDVANVATHFSPSGLGNMGNTMLFTPASLRDVDEGFDGSLNGDDIDFELFDSTADNVGKFDGVPLFDGKMPSANVGLSQNIFAHIDWHKVDCTNF